MSQLPVAVVIPAKARIADDLIPLFAIPTLRELQNHVGGWVEAIWLHKFYATLMCNEDGQRLKLPVNGIATALRGNVPLRGNVVLCGKPDNESELLPIPSATLIALNAISDASATYKAKRLPNQP